MKLTRIMLPLMCVVALTNGCIFDSDNNKSDSAKKGSVSGTVKLTVTGDPVVGMKVYLINTNTSVDSTNGESIRRRSAFVDSAVTDANGKYSITNIAAGRYAIAPVNEDTTTVYTFTQSASSDSCMFSMDGNSLSVNFIAEKTDHTGIIYEDSDIIIDHITYGNIDKYYKSGTVSRTYSRRYWVVFVPYLTGSSSEVMVNTYGLEMRYSPGYTLVLYTQDNCHFYEITTSNPTKVHKFSIYHPLSTPAGSKFNYTFDLDTDTLTEVKQ